MCHNFKYFSSQVGVDTHPCFFAFLAISISTLFSNIIFTLVELLVLHRSLLTKLCNTICNFDWLKWFGVFLMEACILLVPECPTIIDTKWCLSNGC